MIRLRSRAPGKVNLSLLLGPIRADGRHELVTVLESVSLADELTLTAGDGITADEVVCPGVEGDNLAAAAIRALRAHGWTGPAVRIEIAKRIPVAAGMGGGSADAAAALRLAAHLEPAGTEAIGEIAAGLGADVPSQLAPGLAIGRGPGERDHAAAAARSPRLGPPARARSRCPRPPSTPRPTGSSSRGPPTASRPAPPS